MNQLRVRFASKPERKTLPDIDPETGERLFYAHFLENGENPAVKSSPEDQPPNDIAKELSFNYLCPDENQKRAKPKLINIRKLILHAAKNGGNGAREKVRTFPPDPVAITRVAFHVHKNRPGVRVETSSSQRPFFVPDFPWRDSCLAIQTAYGMIKNLPVVISGNGKSKYRFTFDGLHFLLTLLRIVSVGVSDIEPGLESAYFYLLRFGYPISWREYWSLFRTRFNKVEAKGSVKTFREKGAPLNRAGFDNLNKDLPLSFPERYPDYLRALSLDNV